MCNFFVTSRSINLTSEEKEKEEEKEEEEAMSAAAADEDDDDENEGTVGEGMAGVSGMEMQHGWGVKDEENCQL